MTEKHPLPFSRSYWVVPGRLMAGYFPSHPDPSTADRQLSALARCGIRHVVNLMEANERNTMGIPFAPYADALCGHAAEIGAEIVCERYEIPDLSAPTPARMREILDAIDRALEQDAPVYIHCWGGRGRTGTVVGCWLVRHGLARDGAEALRMIGEMRAALPSPAGPSPETSDQIAMVREWEG